MIDRQTWLNRAKQRALVELEHGNIPAAIAVMIDVLDKHPGTHLGAPQDILRQLGKHVSAAGNVDDALDYIKGFN